MANQTVMDDSETQLPISISGSRHRSLNVVDGPLRSTLFRVAWPVLGEQFLNTLVGMFDVFLATQISPAATSAVGIGAYVAWLGSMLVMLIGTGATALISRHCGAKEYSEANRFANQAITLGAILGVLIAFGMATLAPWFASYANLSGETYHIATEFLRIDAFGHLFLSITLVACASLRGSGDTRTPMKVFVVINAVNMFASWSLVYGLGPLPIMGVRGIVLGTVIAQIVGAMMALAVLARGRSGLRLHWNELRINRERVWRIFRIGLPAAADGAVIWCGHFLFLAIISHLAPPPTNELILAAHVIAIRVEALTYLPAVAFGTAAATMIGQALGANQPKRAKRAGLEAVLQCEVIAIAMSAFFYFGAEFIFRKMGDNAEVSAIGIGPFKILAIFQPVLVLSIVLIGGLRGAGDTRFPLLISVFGSVFIRVSIGYIFGIMLGWGLIGAWMGMFADMLWRAVLALFRFTSGRWVHARV